MILNARVKKHSTVGGVTLQWFQIGMEYRVVKQPRVRDDGEIEFRIYVNESYPDALCLQYGCSHLGGTGGEWEFVDDNDVVQFNANDKYDRAMGVL